jgi:hypothetical protein
MAPTTGKRSLRVRTDKQINQQDLDDLVNKIIKGDSKLTKAHALTKVRAQSLVVAIVHTDSVAEIMSDHFSYLRWSGVYVHESCCLGNERHPLPMWGIEGSSMIPWYLISVTDSL